MSGFDTTEDCVIDRLRTLARDRAVVIEDFSMPHERYIGTDGPRLHVVEWGRPDGEPIVFIHPGRLNTHSWDLVCLALQARYRCIAVDAPGHGDSDWDPERRYGLANFAGFLHHALQNLDLQKVVLVGASQGGMQALGFALEYPATLNGLVILDAGPELDAEGVQRQAQEMAIFEALDFEDFVQLSLARRPGADIDKLRFTLRQNLRQQPDGRWRWKFDPGHRTASTPAMQSAELQRMVDAQAHSVVCPVLILRGANSDLLEEPAAIRLAARFARGTWDTIPAARHLLHHDNPAAVIAALDRFMATP